MEVTVHSGTSLEAFSRPDAQSYLGPIRVAGKTGTLQRGKSAPITSWFTGFAPSRDPKVVVTVLLQNSPLWRRKANEVARDLLRVVFAGTRGVSHPFEGTQPTEPTTAGSDAAALED
jgi:cell division protein FtsI/penicillin-binding protein 2